MDDLLQKVKERLASLGYNVDDEKDDWLINFLIDKVKSFICNYCNISEIPNELEIVTIEKVVGEFLSELKTINPDAITSIDITAFARSVSIGDTTVNFGSDLSPEQKLDVLLSSLKDNNDQLEGYRCIKW